MAKNKVLFQQGLGLQEFLSQYDSEGQVPPITFQMAMAHNSFICPNCSHDAYCSLRPRKLFQCNRCRSQISVTAGTIFDSTKLPLPTWFLGIYFITQSKVSVSALSLKTTVFKETLVTLKSIYSFN